VRERERHSVVNWYFSIFEKIFGMEKFNMVYLEKWYISGILEKNLQNPKFYHIFSPKNAILVSKIFGNIAAAVKSENQVTLKMGTRPTNLLAISALGRQTCQLSRQKLGLKNWAIENKYPQIKFPPRYKTWCEKPISMVYLFSIKTEWRKVTCKG
jgi:hypothetical protein